MKCPKCGADESYCDWRLAEEGQFIWNCFECEYIWEGTYQGEQK